MVIRGFIVILASYSRIHALFFPRFHVFSPLFLPHPKPPISQQVPLACWWLSGVFPQLLLLLLHGNHHFWFVFLFFPCKSRCVRIVYIYRSFFEVLSYSLVKLYMNIFDACCISPRLIFMFDSNRLHLKINLKTYGHYTVKQLLYDRV